MLEDDLILSPVFLEYMSNALNLYEDDQKIMHVSGYFFPVKESNHLPKTFFFNSASCWGWGTWKNSWSKFMADPAEIKRKLIEKKGLKQFNFQGNANFLEQLNLNIEHKINTWAVKWYGSIFLNDGYCLHPNHSYVNNCGNDGSGVHADQSGYHYNWPQLNADPTITKIPIKESALSRKLVTQFFTKINKKNRSIRLKAKLKTRYLKPVYQKAKKYIQKDNGYPFLNKTGSKRYEPSSIQIGAHKIEYADFDSFRFMYEEIFKNKIYEFYTGTLSPVIIDAGANIGLATIFFKQLYPTSKIIAFEPDPKIASLFKKNIANYKLHNIQLHEKALGKEEKKVTFFQEGSDAGRVGNVTSSHKLEVEQVKLSSFITQPIDFLKIDIEGAEEDVLFDIKETLHLIHNIFVEFHSFVGKNQNLYKIIEILEKAGFRLYITSPGLTNSAPLSSRRTYLNMDGQLNIFGTKE